MAHLTRRSFALSTLLAACGAHLRTATAAPADGAGAGAQAAYEAAQQGTGFTVGPIVAAHTVYVFFDPACPHCAHLWQEIQPLAKKLRFVWLPVGFLRKTSAPQGATILAASNPAAAMARNEAAVLAGGPGIEVAADLPPEVLAKVNANTRLLNQLGADSVPFIVYRNARSGAYGTHTGALATAELAALVGA